MTPILSIYPLPLVSYAHDASVTLLSSDRKIFACEEEKVSRMMHGIATPPLLSTMMAYRATGTDPREIQRLVVTSADRCAVRPDFSARMQYIRSLLMLSGEVNVQCIPHHLAHSALSTLTSPFDRCLFLTLDAGGDGIMGHWGVFESNTYSIKEEMALSPAVVFSYLTSLAGFSLFESGKLMGLSAFGTVNEKLANWLRSNFWIRNGSASLETSNRVALKWHVEPRPANFDPDFPRRPKYSRTVYTFHDASDAEWLGDIPPCDIAATAQVFFERLLLQIVCNIVTATGMTNLALAGGAFQNVLANARLMSVDGVRAHVPLSPHDSGLALGACLFAALKHDGYRIRDGLSPYLGPSYSSDDIVSAIDSAGLTKEQPQDYVSTIADEIGSGTVVGWFQGRAEFGPRALGARSVLADPRNPLARAHVNQALKHRDWFMPYAPSILEEFGHEFFVDFRPSPFMNVAFKIRPDKVSLIPSALHVDGTCRAHSVKADDNPLYHSLITAFHKKTGIPLLLNTSFNRHGVPIVNTPRQAVQHLIDGHIQLLAIGDYIVGSNRHFSAPPVKSDEFSFTLDLLTFATKLASRGRTTQAQVILNRLNRGFEVVDHGIACQGECVWRLGEPDAVLSQRIDSILRFI